MTKKERKTRLWHIDPSMFQPGPKAGLLERHVLGRGRALGKFTLYTLFFAYPIILVGLGVMLGALVFWGSLAGSVGIIWLAIRMGGYSQNFASWGVGYTKFVGLVAAFGIYLGVVLGLIYIRIWTIPILGGVLATVLVLGIWRISNRGT